MEKHHRRIAMELTDKKTRPSLEHFEGLQSVRTTFRFSKQALEAQAYLRKRLKITPQKMLNNVTTSGFLANNELAEVLAELTEAARKSAESDPTGVRKTWGISKATLYALNKTAKEKGITRDALVEGIIVCMEILCKAADQKRPENHKIALEMVEKFWVQAQDLNQELVDLLGEEDPIVMRLGDVLSMLDSLNQAIEAEIEQGIPVSPTF
jgi:hypothetical protein